MISRLAALQQKAGGAVTPTGENHAQPAQGGVQAQGQAQALTQQQMMMQQQQQQMMMQQQMMQRQQGKFNHISMLRL